MTVENARTGPVDPMMHYIYEHVTIVRSFKKNEIACFKYWVLHHNIYILPSKLTIGIPPISAYVQPTHAVARIVSMAPIWSSVTFP